MVLTDEQEGSQGFVELPEEDPTILAFLITVLYHDWSLDWASICNRIQTVLAGGKRTGAGQMPASDSKDPLDEKNHVAAAKLYAMADKFECLEAKKWAAEIFANAVMDDAFTLGDLVDVIALVYAESPENDHGLKKWVVYLAQKARPQLANLERFRSVFDASTQFAWDFATKYANANHVWCPKCKKKIELLQCPCGLEGVCGYKACTQQNLENFCCWVCDQRGKLLREAPQTESVVGDKKACTVKESSIRVAKRGFELHEVDPESGHG